MIKLSYHQKLRAFISPTPIGKINNPKGSETLYAFFCPKHGFVTDIEHTNGVSCPICTEENLNALHSSNRNTERPRIPV